MSQYTRDPSVAQRELGAGVAENQLLLGWSLSRRGRGPAEQPPVVGKRDLARERKLLAALSPFRERIETLVLRLSRRNRMSKSKKCQGE